MLQEVKSLIIKALRENPLGAQRVLNEMEAGKKINAIKELRELGRSVTNTRTVFGLKESKDFVEEYMYNADPNGYNYDYKVRRNQFIKDISSKGKRAKKSLAYQFDGVDIRQVDTKTLKTLYKSLKKELKKRGEKI